MNRRDFLKYGASLGASTLLSGERTLTRHPAFATKHLVVIIYGNGARKKDVVDNVELAPCQNRMARQGTIFTEDYGETANLHGYMVSEMLQGARERGSQRPRLPTWNEYVRKKTGAKATDFFVLQGVSYYRAWALDVKHYSQHPDYGLRYGATSLTMNKTFFPDNGRTPREIVDLNVENGLGASVKERRELEAFVTDAIARRSYVPPSTREPLIDRPAQYGDAQVLTLAPEILKAFRPKILTLQICGLADAHADFGHRSLRTGYTDYTRHVRTTDELIGRLWRAIENDPGLRGKTALMLRPDCGRDTNVDAFGQLGHTEGDYHAHYVWSMALGPDFETGAVVTEPVSRRDLAPTITYLMSGERAEHATGHVRTQMFRKDVRRRWRESGEAVRAPALAKARVRGL